MNEPVPSPSCAGDALRRSLAHVPRVTLRQAGDEMHETPVLRPAATASSGAGALPQRIGSYLVTGEIAHGGIGVVLKARDLDLCRDVALKVLHSRHRGNQDLLRRFVEEAQIGSQLQHPGIVPVHGLGVLEGGLPFLAMKLVKGRTLAAILEARREPAEDRQRLLGIFERTCQAMAYAHARRVVHRDLKPANVMVGAFGEVQLMDWGLAKVLSRPETAAARQQSTAAPSIIATIRTASGSSQSIAGSVFGTPAYMAPEQARGRLESIDERSDVFGLGAILCEILTGSPPYTGETQEAIFEKARKGYLDDALARLNECRAPADLVDLARRALAFEPRERPADAGAVAQAVQAHLESLEEGRRRHGIEAAESRARVREERRARRLLLGLAAAALLLLAIGAGAWTVLDREGRRAASAAAAMARESSEAAQRLLGEARAAAAGGARAWKEQRPLWERAVLAAADAELRSAGAPAAALGVIRELRGAAESEATKARDAALRAERNRRMVDRLDDIRLRSYAYLSWPRCHAEYRQAFRDFGIDVEKLGVEEATRAIAESGIAQELGMAIARWAWSKRELFGEKSASAPKLWQIAERIDPDPFRRRIREAVASWNVSTLQGLAAEARGKDLPAPALELLADAAGSAGAAPRASQLLLEALRRDPTQANLHFLLMIKTEDSLLGLASWISAVALRPTSAEAMRTHQALWEGELWQQWVEEVMRLQPGRPVDMQTMGRCLLQQQEAHHEQALAWLQAALQLDPTQYSAGHNSGLLLTRKGDLDGAVRAYESVLRLGRHAMTLQNLGYLRRQQGDLDGAIAAWTETITRLGNEPDEQAKLHSEIGKLFEVKGNLEAAIFHQRAAQLLNPADAWPYYWLGASLLKQGRLADALAQFQAALEKDDGGTGNNAFLMAVPTLEQLKLPARDPQMESLLDALGATLEGGMASGRFTHPRLRAVVVRVHEARLEPLPVEEAIERARRIVARHPSIPELRVLAGLVAWRAGKRREAIETIEAAVLELDPGSPLVARLRELRTAVLPDLLTFGSIDAALEEETRLLAAGETWRYFPGVAEPSPGEQWTEPGFDDSVWKEGPSGFGYGDGDDATVLADMPGRYTTVFIRKVITLPPLKPGERVELRVLSDDGFAAYVNGKRAGRLRIGIASTSTLTVALNHEATQPDVLDITHLVTPGSNQLALLGVNESVSSSDFSLSPEVYLTPGKDPAMDETRLREFRAVAGGEDAPARAAYLEGRILERAGRGGEAIQAFERALVASPESLPPLQRCLACLDGAGRATEATARLEAAFRGGPRIPADLLGRWVQARRAAGAGWNELLAAWPRRAAPFEIILSPRASDRGIAWRYTREPAGKHWAEDDFDDGLWFEGEAAFGTAINDSAIVPRTPWTTSDIWLRRRFTVDLPVAPPAGLRFALVAHAAHDDGAEIHLNGAQIFRSSGWTHAYAQAVHPDLGPLRGGENLLAVHCRNTGADGYIDVELALRISTAD